MKPSSEVFKALREKFNRRIMAVDSHTAGEPTRLILGYENLPGKQMAEKRLWTMEHLDPVRLLLTREPRGHRDIFAALVTAPVSPAGDFGLIYMDAKRYPYLCGHAVIGAVVTLIAAGVVEATDGENTVVVDTPSGPVRAKAVVARGKVESVAIQMVPGFVYATGCQLSLEGFGEIKVDLVCVGGFFVMVDTEQLNISLTRRNHARLIDLGMAVIDAANRQLSVEHPTRKEVQTVDVAEFYSAAEDDRRRGKSVVILGQGHLDRSPCGTGTSAKMTLLHHKGKLELNQTFVNTSPLGTTFSGRLTAETRVGEFPAVVAEITGSAQITGLHEFVVDPQDPFPDGYLL